MFTLTPVTHICTEHHEGCKRVWRTQEPALLNPEPIIYELCEVCAVADKQYADNVIGGVE